MEQPANKAKSYKQIFDNEMAKLIQTYALKELMIQEVGNLRYYPIYGNQ